MSIAIDTGELDTKNARKARGAFFTPELIARFLSDWAIRSPNDRVLEPSTGDAAFLVESVRRLRALGSENPLVFGVEIHEESVRTASRRVRMAGGDPRIVHGDFFQVVPNQDYTAVIGNPPYIRYQDFSGESRIRSRRAALQAGVALSGLASSWAAFTVQSALHLGVGGRLGLVLPAELLSVNYAAPVRQFLFEKFRSVELVLFSEQVFPDAETDVVLLLAEGYGQGPTDHARIRQATDPKSLESMSAAITWAPVNPAGKWTSLLLGTDSTGPLAALAASGQFDTLDSWGDTTLGMVTGNNSYFALSPARAQELGLSQEDLVRLSPPGSAHLRGLSFSHFDWAKLGREHRSTWMFRPNDELSDAAAAYIAAGHVAGVDQAYKCRVRRSWYRVPLLPPADLLLTAMNADTPRLTTNTARAHHLNSVHGVYLDSSNRALGRRLLPLASVNSVTLLSAEIVGRSYGGGILKLEPREADVWAVPSPALLEEHAEELESIRNHVAKSLRTGRLLEAVSLVDEVLLLRPTLLNPEELESVRAAHWRMSTRRKVRSDSGR